jgi:hypothetical protein
MREAARQTILRKYDLSACLKRQIQLINKIGKPKVARRG